MLTNLPETEEGMETGLCGVLQQKSGRRSHLHNGFLGPSAVVAINDGQIHLKIPLTLLHHLPTALLKNPIFLIHLLGRMHTLDHPDIVHQQNLGVS